MIVALKEGAHLYTRQQGTYDTALHLAAGKGAVNTALILIFDYHFDMDVRNNRNYTPAMVALLGYWFYLPPRKICIQSLWLPAIR